ncbi:CRISPR-associated helicase Cas3 [Parascardovia denticolens IPLA 20019]|uniref:CRISPR-associated helicase/endonuclease Cas3 n=1 Tax=Parascardovia denticolens TaxID=78258 RepID=UPI000266C121|nr:CRISPR-associated helicase/endonuclease Cas3 [Parascardovia denticolens]EIT88138.1 CRISPR-associated helicase Cas3 [Parascardovia denticolens IPLA 20019]
MMIKDLLARKDQSGRAQTLQSHLFGAATLSGSFEDKFSSLSRLAAFLHDAGKASGDFQDYLLSDDGIRGSVIHAWQGAFMIDDLDAQNGYAKVAQQLLELVISKHHGALPDCVDQDGMTPFFDNFSAENKQDGKYSYNEVKRNLNDLQPQISKLFLEASDEIESFFVGMSEIRNAHGKQLSRESQFFYLGMLVKYIYSRLIDADRTDAASFESHTTYQSKDVRWEELISKLDKKMSGFDSATPINAVRNKISQTCRRASDRKTGIYKLSVPTGGGKTLASLSFAMRHAQKTGKRRVIYVIPYLSITTQTSQTFRDMLNLPEGNDVILEHYSSAMNETIEEITKERTDEEEEKESTKSKARKLAAERWNNPIIVTTMVQFLETIMSARGTNLRKFHNMADSVIIFDEIQSLPTDTINLFNEIISFLSGILGSTILLCSATQPLLEQTNRDNLCLASEPNLIKLNEQDSRFLKRTNIVASTKDKDCDELAEFAFEQAKENGDCLIILNLKSKAKNIYQALRDLNEDNQFDLIHLSTSMCGKHRKNQLDHIRNSFKSSEAKPIICVSTQLIEAGVDISFSCVVRAMAGLDSILQAAGRCNRNGESPTPKNVYVFPVKDEKGLSYLPDIKLGKELMSQLIREYPDEDLLSDAMLTEYYRRYFARLQPDDRKQFSKMDYPLKGFHTSAYDLLARNRMWRGTYKNRRGADFPYYYAQAFKTVSDNFHLIPGAACNVIVPYGDSGELLELLSASDMDTRYKALHNLQDYTISLFEWEERSLHESHAIKLIDDTFEIYVLNQEYYNEEYGFTVEASMPLQMY